MKKGFWVLFWMEYGRGHTIREETYVFLKYEDGYAEKDEENLRSEVSNWCQYDKQGCDRDRYKYGFEIVPKPPNIWLEDELKKLRGKHEQIVFQENLIKSELSGSNQMKVTLSIRKYINWIWFIERNRDIRKEYKKLSDIPSPISKDVFINESEFIEVSKVCGDEECEELINTSCGKDIDIEWIDDFDYQAKIDKFKIQDRSTGLDIVKENQI